MVTKPRRLLLFVAILAVVAAGWCIARLRARTAVQARAQDTQAGAVDVEGLSRLGLSFAPVDPASTRVGVGRDRAIAIARDANPHAQAATSETVMSCIYR